MKSPRLIEGKKKMRPCDSS